MLSDDPAFEQFALPAQKMAQEILAQSPNFMISTLRYLKNFPLFLFQLPSATKATSVIYSDQGSPFFTLHPHLLGPDVSQQIKYTPLWLAGIIALCTKAKASSIVVFFSPELSIELSLSVLKSTNVTRASEICASNNNLGVLFSSSVESSSAVLYAPRDLISQPTTSVLQIINQVLPVYRELTALYLVSANLDSADSTREIILLGTYRAPDFDTSQIQQIVEHLQKSLLSAALDQILNYSMILLAPQSQLPQILKPACALQPLWRNPLPF